MLCLSWLPVTLLPGEEEILPCSCQVVVKVQVTPEPSFTTEEGLLSEAGSPSSALRLRWYLPGQEV